MLGESAVLPARKKVNLHFRATTEEDFFLKKEETFSPWSVLWHILMCYWVLVSGYTYYTYTVRQDFLWQAQIKQFT